MADAKCPTGRAFDDERVKPAETGLTVDRTCGIILAAGLSTRMDRPKALLTLGGIPLVEHAVRSFWAAGVRDVTVVIGYRAGELVPILERLEVTMVLNPRYHEGMLSSVKAGVARLAPAVLAFYVLPVDCPVIRQETIRSLAHVIGDRLVAYPCYTGRRGHPPLIRAGLIPHILAWNQPGGLAAALRVQGGAAASIETADPGVVMDIDTPDDYAACVDAYEREHGQAAVKPERATAARVT